MASLFLRQFFSLCRKNWIVLSKHRILNLIRCFLLPIAYAVFLSLAQNFVAQPNNLGFGTPLAIQSLAQTFDGFKIVWTDSTNGTGSPTADEIMSIVTRSFSPSQRSAVDKVATPHDLLVSCPSNYNGLSECFSAVVFNSLPSSPQDATPVNYTLRGGAGLTFVDVENHAGDYEKRLLPLQWAIDSAIIQLRTGVTFPTPQEWPYTQETNEEQSENTRISFVNGVRNLLVLALFVDFLGIVYQLSGSFMSERASRLTSHLEAMGCLRSARIISWHLSISAAYLPAWIVMSVAWRYRIFAETNTGLIIVVHLLTGLSLASWCLFASTPFGKSPQLAAIASTFFAVLLAIIALITKSRAGTASILTLIFPPMFYVYVIRAICGWELEHLPADVLRGDPRGKVVILPLIIIAIINTFLYPILALWMEHILYDAKEPNVSLWSRFLSRKKPSLAISESHPGTSHPPTSAISIRNLSKTFNSGKVTAIADLSLEIPRTGIYCLLGSNGSGKSTTLEILAGLLGRSDGAVTFEGGVSRPTRGQLGIVPQRNVLFSELSCFQTVKLWSDIKWPVGVTETRSDLIALLKSCDLDKKIHANAGNLSGGQKRKLQMAIGLVGGSNILLVDEATSGVDPLSRRAIWRALTAVRTERTIVFTTHFLDEADLLADDIAILAAPGKLLAHGSPVTLKSSLGEGYVAHVSFATASEKLSALAKVSRVLQQIQRIAPGSVVIASTEDTASYLLRSKDATTIARVLDMLEGEKGVLGIKEYDVHGATLEEIFLRLMATEAEGGAMDATEKGDRTDSNSGTPIPTILPSADEEMPLSNGTKTSAWGQALVVVRKRWLVNRRSWLTPLLMVVIAVCGTCVPLFFMSGRAQGCTLNFSVQESIPLYLPLSLPVGLLLNVTSKPVLSPSNIADSLGLSSNLYTPVPTGSTFNADISDNYRQMLLGGLSLDLPTGNALLAYEASSLSLNGASLLNLASNILYNQALNSTGAGAGTGPHILAYYSNLPVVFGQGTAEALKWIAFYGAALAVYPAFFALYITRERRSSVQAMQLSNGMSPLGLYLGHLLSEIPLILLVSTVIIAIFAGATTQFHSPGFMWLVLVLYGLAGSLLAFCVSLFAPSALAAFAMIAGYQVVIFMLYVAGYLLTLTYARSSNAKSVLNIVHYTMSLLSPVAAPARAALVSVNLFSFLCDGEGNFSTSPDGVISKFGSPIVYLIGFCLFFFGILIAVDSTSPLRIRLPRLHRSAEMEEKPKGEDVVAEADRVSSSDDALRVLSISKSFDKSRPVVDDVSFGVSKETFSLLGPNGAGKTTTFNMIRGGIRPDTGDVLLNGVSITQHPNQARVNLGLCPQFTAIDSQLTVREHLEVYGRLKGLKGDDLQKNIEILMEGTALTQYADRLASKLSGGNQRKLSLAIALIGNPQVLLIDEYSTGIDAATKRHMWTTLKRVARGKAVVITTHSMEEASALSNRVGILARKMLAVGTISSLAARYPAYELHFACRSPTDALRVRELMARHFPGGRQAEDVATRWEIPIDGDIRRSLADLFRVLSQEEGLPEFAVERLGLEVVFLKVIREHNIQEDDAEAHRGSRSRWIC